MDSLSTHTLAHSFLSRRPHTERAPDWTTQSQLPSRAWGSAQGQSTDCRILERTGMLFFTPTRRGQMQNLENATAVNLQQETLKWWARISSECACGLVGAASYFCSWKACFSSSYAWVQLRALDFTRLYQMTFEWSALVLKWHGSCPNLGVKSTRQQNTQTP